MEISRDEFIDAFAISFHVHSLKLWDRRSKEPPLHVSNSMHQVIGMNGGQMGLKSSAFSTIIEPVIQELHRTLPKGQRPEMREIAGLAYDALIRAGIEVTIVPHNFGHGGRRD